MKLAFPTTFITALLLSAVQAYDADDFKGKFDGTDTVGIHGDHGIEEDGKMKLHFKTVKTHDDEAVRSRARSSTRGSTKTIPRTSSAFGSRMEDSI